MFLTGDFWRGHDWYWVSGWVMVTCAVGAALPHVCQKTGMMAEEKCFSSSIENSKQISWKWWSLQTLFGLFLKLWIKKNIFHHSLHSGLKFKFRFWHISAGVFHCGFPGAVMTRCAPFAIFLHRCFANWAPAVSLRRSVLTLTHLSSDKSST